MWKGSISFGLVNIPVRMYAAVEDTTVHFTQLHAACHTPIKYQKVCPHCQVEVGTDEIVRGYELNQGQYVMITGEEWARFQEHRSPTVDILRFVRLEEVDPVFFDRSYFLEPAETGEKAYRLLTRAMEETGMAGIGAAVIRTKQALAAVRVYSGGLMLELMHYPDAIRPFHHLNIPTGEPAEKELMMAVTLIHNLTEPFQPEHYVDARRQNIMELIEKKAAEQQVVAAPGDGGEAVADLLAALEASLRSKHGEEVRR